MNSNVISVVKYLVIIPALLSVCIFNTFIYSANAATSTSATIDPVTLQNPLKNIATIDGLLIAILNIIMVLMVPVIVFFIIYAGFKYVMAQGNASQVEEATRALTYAIIGGVLILGAVAISQIIKSVVDAF